MVRPSSSLTSRRIHCQTWARLISALRAAQLLLGHTKISPLLPPPSRSDTPCLGASGAELTFNHSMTLVLAGTAVLADSRGHPGWQRSGGLARNRKFEDSPLERDGFELPVPRYLRWSLLTRLVSMLGDHCGGLFVRPYRSSHDSPLEGNGFELPVPGF